MNRYILETKELTKKFGRQKAVANLSLQIEKNSVYVLLGPNGAGKSNILEAVAMLAWENLKVRTLLLGLPDSRIKEVLEIVDLKNTGKKKSGQFSIGMKQRLGIAIALLNHPRLLILDEPTNGLDPLGIQELRDLIKSFPEQGITVILSSHILAEVEQIADHIGIINNGRLEYQNAINHQENLEELFMNVVKKGRRENEHAL